MNLFFLSGCLFLGYELGRNNLGNLFGMAIGTRMLPFVFSVVLAGVFVFLGAFFGGSGTTSEILGMAPDFTLMIAFTVCVAGALVLALLTKFGIPVSIAQSMIGSLLGADLYFEIQIDYGQLIKIATAWIYSPILSFSIAFFLFYVIRFFFKSCPIGVLYRDIFTRWGLICVGSFSAYCLGANNMAVIIGPYLATGLFNEVILIILISVAVFFGFFRADKQVIRTLSSGLFPLSPIESFVAVLGASLTLFIFSSTLLRDVFVFLGIPTLPLIPISVTHALIGSIVGIAIAKGRLGLKTSTLGRIFGAWIFVPIISGLISYSILTIVGLYGV